MLNIIDSNYRFLQSLPFEIGIYTDEIRNNVKIVNFQFNGNNCYLTHLDLPKFNIETETAIFDRENKQWNIVDKNSVLTSQERRDKKLQELQSYLSQFKECIIKYGNIQIKSDINIAQEVLKNKITNGEFFDYDIDKFAISITSVPKLVAQQFNQQVESFKTDLRAFRLFYEGLINKSDNPEMIEFNPIKLRGSEDYFEPQMVVLELIGNYKPVSLASI